MKGIIMLILFSKNKQTKSSRVTAQYDWKGQGQRPWSVKYFEFPYKMGVPPLHVKKCKTLKSLLKMKFYD